MSETLEEQQARIASDERTFEALAEQGADFAKDHLVDFFFVGDEDRLEKLAQILIAQGYQKNAEHAVEQEILVQRMFTLNTLRSQEITKELHNLAKIQGVAFDGWGTVAKK